MVLSLAVGDNDGLLGHIDQVDVVPVDDEALADADEGRLLFSKLLADEVSQLSELIGNQMVVAILCEDFGIVALRRNKHQPL